MHALVTGASRGLGLAMAEELVDRGWSVICLGRDRSRLDEAVEQLRSRGGTAEAHAVDVVSASEVERLFERLATSGRAPRLVVCNAGVFVRGEVSAIDIEDWRRVIDINLTGAFTVAKAAARTMRELPVTDGLRGQIVFINSGAGDRPYAPGGSYTASKHGLLGLSGALREEVRSEQINVTDMMVRASFESELSARTAVRLPASIVGTVLGRIVDLPGGAYISRVDVSRNGA